MCEYVNREGSTDNLKRTAWTAGMVRCIDWRVLWWLSVRQCLKFGYIHLETVLQTGSQLLRTMPQTGAPSLGDSAPHWDIFTWRLSLNLAYIHLDTVPQTQSKYLDTVTQDGSQ